MKMEEYGMILQMNWKKMTDNGGTMKKSVLKVQMFGTYSTI